MIYLDNGATTFPKPPEVIEAFMDAAMNYCANPGRSGHYMAARTDHEIYKARVSLAGLFNIDSPERIVFTKNCTEGLNIAINGLLKPGDHVITSSMEHNSVVRPLFFAASKGVDVTYINCDRRGVIDVEDIKNAVRRETRLIVITAASNVTGTRMPLEEIGRLALRNGILFMVDAAQAAGHTELDVGRLHIDILAAPGHKGLMGMQGTGFLYVREGISPTPIVRGGTGHRSEELQQPGDFPEGMEAGTLNAPGIIALGAAADFIRKIGVSTIEHHLRELTVKLKHELMEMKGVMVYGITDDNNPEFANGTGIIAANVRDIDCQETALLLNDRYDIAVRAGYHCSYMAHETIGTERTGCVRLCPGFYSSEKDIRAAADAIYAISRRKH